MDFLFVKRFIASFIIFCIFVFEMPKLIIITQLDGAPYHILPQFNGPESRSNPIWIFVHGLFSSIYLGTIAYQNIGFNTILKPKKDFTWVFHGIFFLLIMFNCKILGDLPDIIAVVINFGLLILMMILIEFDLFFPLLLVAGFPVYFFNIFGLSHTPYFVPVLIFITLMSLGNTYATAFLLRRKVD